LIRASGGAEAAAAAEKKLQAKQAPAVRSDKQRETEEEKLHRMKSCVPCSLLHCIFVTSYTPFSLHFVTSYTPFSTAFL
jgi:hypothetical protein